MWICITIFGMPMLLKHCFNYFWNAILRISRKPLTETRTFIRLHFCETERFNVKIKNFFQGCGAFSGKIQRHIKGFLSSMWPSSSLSLSLSLFSFISVHLVSLSRICSVWIKSFFPSRIRYFSCCLPYFLQLSHSVAPFFLLRPIYPPSVLPSNLPS